MNIYFSGIGGAGIGPLALIAHQAGFDVSGSDSQKSQYTEYLQKLGIKLHIGQTSEQIGKEHAKNPIDWIVFSSAVYITNPNHPELTFARENNIKCSKRDECLNLILEQKKLSLIAIAGTHGKTTTTALTVWLLKELKIPVSYSVGAKVQSEPMGLYDPDSKYFVYECDEFDRNFLSFKPQSSIITVVDWDHHDIYPTQESYKQAFRDFIGQSEHTLILEKDAKYLDIAQSETVKVLGKESGEMIGLNLHGLHNRQNAYVAIEAIAMLFGKKIDELVDIANRFPGSSRRFEELAPNIYTDYAHTPEEIKATIQLAKEVSNNVVVVYEPLTDRRQHYMKDQYCSVFEPVKKVYWLPSYLAREDPSVPILTPQELILGLSSHTNAVVATKSDALRETILAHATSGDLVICMAGGGGDSLDEWARKNLTAPEAGGN